MKDETYDNLGRAAMQAWGRMKKAQGKSWGEWMIIGEGLMAGREWAMHQAGTNAPEGKGYTLAFGEWLQQYKLSDMDKSDRAKLLQLIEERPAVEEWRTTLDDHTRRNLNNPVSVWRKWTAATRVRPKKSRTAPGARERHANEGLQARVDELEQELEAAELNREEIRVHLAEAVNEIAELKRPKAKMAKGAFTPGDMATLDAIRRGEPGEIADRLISRFGFTDASKIAEFIRYKQDK
jgi:hypothetical protein